MKEYISPASRMHPPEGVLAPMDELRDEIRADVQREIEADHWRAVGALSAAGQERLLHAIDTDGANRYEPPECVHGVRFREWCFGCFCELASDYTQFKRDTRRAFGVLYRLHVVPEAVTTGDIRWLEEWSESE